MWPSLNVAMVAMPDAWTPCALTAKTGSPMQPSSRYRPVAAMPRREPSSAPTNSTLKVCNETGT